MIALVDAILRGLAFFVLGIVTLLLLIMIWSRLDVTINGHRYAMSLGKYQEVK